MNLDNLESVRYIIPELVLIAGLVLVILSDIALKKFRNVLNPVLTFATLGLVFSELLSLSPLSIKERGQLVEELLRLANG